MSDREKAAGRVRGRGGEETNREEFPLPTKSVWTSSIAHSKVRGGGERSCTAFIDRCLMHAHRHTDTHDQKNMGQ